MGTKSKHLSSEKTTARNGVGFPTFSEFYQEVHGFPPFIWQRKLAETVWRDQTWPEQIAAPPGAGKTSCLDIALWALAKQVHEYGIEGRTLPLRIFLTVERRLVVDHAAKHAKIISDSIEEKSELTSVKAALWKLLPKDWDGFALGVTSLHGAKQAEKDWLRPFGAQIVTCTVMQLASRTLFRGVGVSPGTLPIHAALTGIDRLILVDEPHLVPASVYMWREAEELQRQYEEIVPVGQTVVLGATVPPHLSGKAFKGSLEGDPSSVAQSKQAAIKQASLCSVSTEAGISAIVNAACEAWENRDEQGGDGVLVIVNTIAMAIKVREQIAGKLKKEKELHLNLLTSTVRPLDRSEAVFGPDSITVATQTVEVGVDIDACALITQLAAMPALIQRFGRFNRSGNRRIVPASIIDILKDSATAAIYGSGQVESTRTFLKQAQNNKPTFEFSFLDAPEATWEEKPRLVGIQPFIPRLTATRPPALVPWEAMAYGPDRVDRASISVAWRENLDVLNRVRILPEETINVPLWAAQKFVSAPAENLKFSDTVAGLPRKVGNAQIGVSCRIKRGDRWVQPSQTNELLADSILVVSTSAGGYSPNTGWTGTTSDPAEPVEDHSLRTVLERGEGYFDAGVLLGQDTVESRLDEGIDLYEEVERELEERVADAQILKNLKVEGRYVAVGKRTLKQDFYSYISLADHSFQVAEFAETYAQLMGLASELVDTVKRAGMCHDFGKSDPLFQTRLNNKAKDSEPLAKPRGSIYRENGFAGSDDWRHEVLSARAILGEDREAELARYLVLTHHGWGRRVINHAGTTILNTSAYEALEQRFGPWGLALLEATLRISDWRASAKPESGGHKWDELKVTFAPEKAEKEPEFVTLTGMRPYTLNMLFGGIGALAAAGSGARYRVHNGVVQIITTKEINWNLEYWNRFFEVMKTGAKGTQGDSKWRDMHKNWMLENQPDVQPMLFDAYPEPSGGRFFSVPIHLRNSKPFDVLACSDSTLRTDSLFNSDTQIVHGKGNGGLDTSGENRMIGDIGYAFSEDQLAWSITGMIALGMPASEYGVGVERRILRVPLPDFWVTLRELRDLFISPLPSVKELEWRYAGTTASAQIKYWDPITNDSNN